MRLLNVNSQQIQEFPASVPRPRYVIASHRWLCEGGEPSYQDVIKYRHRQTKGWEKIKGFCDVVRRYFDEYSRCHIEWIWIDTICIDKRSSQEVSTAINSMFQFYSEAYYCLAYLSDVSTQRATRFEETEWFRRSWTLQELMAPRTVIFFSREWTIIGYKGQVRAKMAGFAGADLTSLVHYATTIPSYVLQDPSLIKSVSEGEKWRWAENRIATREEDQAYALLGLFNVFLTPIYGQGLRNATRQVQRAVRDDRGTLEEEDTSDIDEQKETDSARKNWLNSLTKSSPTSREMRNAQEVINAQKMRSTQEASSARMAYDRMRGHGVGHEQAIQALATALQRSNPGLTREGALAGARGRLTYRVDISRADDSGSDTDDWW